MKFTKNLLSTPYCYLATFRLLSTKELVRGGPCADEVDLGLPGYTWVYQKVIYNIGTEILIFTSNLQNAAPRGRTEKLGRGPESSRRDASF